MNMNQLARKITKSEALKKQVSIGQVKEIMKLLALVLAQDKLTFTEFLKYGIRVESREAKKNSK